jgi:hypothetical protein
MKFAVLLTIAALAGVTGCSNAGRISVREGPTSTVPSTTIPGTTVITELDSAKTFRLRVGEVLSVRLADAATRWADLRVTSDGVLRAEPAPDQPPHGIAARWTAVQVGSVRIPATGTAWCAPNTACPMWARLFDVTVVVA